MLVKTEQTPQLARLFYLAGLIGEGEFKGHGARHKPILDVLTQNVSLETFRDLLAADLSFKSKPARPAAAPPFRQLHGRERVRRGLGAVLRAARR
jgi:hypothetical protein